MLITALMLIAAAINLSPIVGVVSAGRLQALYGVALDDPNLVLLMRHRAVLLGIVGGLLAVAAFQAALRPAAIVAGLVSMLSYVVIARLVGSYNSQLRNVLGVDLFALACLIVAAVLEAAREA